MLKLIQCEMRKLKRKHFVSFVIFAALLFPIPFTALVLAGSMGNFTGFEAVFGLLVTMGMPIMLPAVLGIIAAMLFFMERDNDTLKNLRIIPTSPAKIATAKIAVLYFGTDLCLCHHGFVNGWRPDCRKRVDKYWGKLWDCNYHSIALHNKYFAGCHCDCRI